MAVLHVPASLRALTGGRERFDAPGATTLRQVVSMVAQECPELAARIVEDGMLRPDMAVAIDGSIIEEGGILTPVAPDAEIYLVPPIGGGAPCVSFESRAGQPHSPARSTATAR